MNAFPNPHRTDANGMELRDYFAAKTVTWFLTELMAEDMLDDPALTRQFAAEHAYRMADAMMEARDAAQ